jgi:hypothetical protein
MDLFKISIYGIYLKLAFITLSLKDNGNALGLDECPLPGRPFPAEAYGQVL